MGVKRNIILMSSLAVLLLFISNGSSGQSLQNMPLSEFHYLTFSGKMDSLAKRQHSALKPYTWEHVGGRSLPQYVFERNFPRFPRIGNKIFREDLVRLREEDYAIRINALLDFRLGSDLGKRRSTYLNTRGVNIEGEIGKKVGFSTSFYENQASYPEFLDTFIRANRVVPGQARIRPFGNAYDFGWADGHVNYKASKHFNFQLGHGKHFIGDGYRSLLLSDHAHVYPYLKITTTLGPAQYTNIYSEFQDFRTSNLSVDSVYTKKKARIHFLDFSIGEKLSLGIFEGIIWRASDSISHRGYDFNYWNPIIFLRPIEYAVGSPDNVILGANFRYKLDHESSLYAQLVIDELKVSEFISGNGWWGNKQGFQIGYKDRSLLGIEGLYYLVEYNRVRPYTYSQRSSRQSYVHNNLALAHPLGANFWELVNRAQYVLWDIRLEGNLVISGFGIDTDSINWGKDPDRSFNQFRPSDYGNKIGQGLKTRLIHSDLKASYLLNPITDLRISLSLTGRWMSNSLWKEESYFIQFGLSTSLHNFYYDFR